MPGTNIGGFFMSLGLNPDKNSFETGNKLIDGVAESFNKLIGAARNAAVVMASTALASGAMASQEIHTAEVIGSTTEKLNLWKAAAKIAGADANGLVGAIGKLGNVMNHLTIDGSGLEAYAEQLGKLQIGFDELEGMDPADAMKTIIERAQAQLDGTNETKLRITTIVGDILGEAGQQLFVDLQRQGMSIGDFLNGVGRTQFETNEDKEAAAAFVTETRYIKEELTSLTKLFGDNVARELIPYVKDLKEWLLEHGPEIASTLGEIAKGVGSLVGKIVDTVEDVLNNEELKETAESIVDSVKTTASETKEMVKSAAQGDWSSAGEHYVAAAKAAAAPVVDLADKVDQKNQQQEQKDLGMNDVQYTDLNYVRGLVEDMWKAANPRAWMITPWNKLEYDKLNPRMKNLIDKVGGKENFKWLKDGIMRPDGTVTQVAPDDWVFAARNVGDLARAFIPQSMTQVQAPAEYVINQNFTINGGNDIPQVLKAQAYRGTQEGLMAVLEQSSRRLELMSGTR